MEADRHNQSDPQEVTALQRRLRFGLDRAQRDATFSLAAGWSSPAANVVRGALDADPSAANAFLRQSSSIHFQPQALLLPRLRPNG